MSKKMIEKQIFARRQRKGLIPDGSLFSDVKHCLDHSVASSMLNCFTTPFYCRGKQSNKQTHSQRKVQPVITEAFE